MGSLAAGAAALADVAVRRAPALAQDPPKEPFAPDFVERLAQELAKTEFAKPAVDVPASFNALTAEQYRAIRFRDDRAIWGGESAGYELRLLPMGWIFDAPVEIWLVEEGQARRLVAGEEYFSLGGLEAESGAPFGFSGFSIHAPIKRADALDEFAAFQGATYFRAVGRAELYGLSARGLAVETARPGGEEFPLFRAFWIERPAGTDAGIVVHALLDSVSTSGAYRFHIVPGATTAIDVELVLFPRRALTHVGIAPLTSMFLHGSAHNRRQGDVRPAVHDSEGLVILNGNGEHIWRPLTNPRMLQTSAFLDRNPRGFGLAQRTRAFAAYQDLEAHYERRPTAWVAPRQGWGEGSVELVEIPAEEEIHDNIVAYWKPGKALEPGTAHRFGYRLSWGPDVPEPWTGARVSRTAVGAGADGDSAHVVVDFEGPPVAEAAELPTAEASASAGAISNLAVERNPEIRGVRVNFDLATAGTEIIELRLALRLAGRTISESWLYRWTRT
jgi:glucans biosynthesis protein